MVDPLEPLWLPHPPPDPADQGVNLWRKALESYLDQLRLKVEELIDDDPTDPDPVPYPGSRTWPGFTCAYYPLKRDFNVTAGISGSLAWCLESDTPALIYGMDASSAVVCCERLYDRWRAVPLSATPGAGALVCTVPAGNCTVAACYVPLTGASGTGTQRGKFWVGNSSDDTILTIDPHANFATSSFSIGASDAVPRHLIYDSYNDRVFAVNAAGTRIAELDPTDGSNVAQSTGWTALTYVIPTPTKLWLTKTSGANTARLQYLDPTNLAAVAVNPGLVIEGASGGVYLPEYDYLAVIVGAGDNNIRFVDVPTDTLISSIDTGSGQVNWTRAWIAELDTIVAGGATNFMAFNIFSKTLASWVNKDRFGDGSGTMGHSYYIPEYKEVLASCGYPWWVLPTVID